MAEKKKKKTKYDRWFLIVLALLLYTLTAQLFDLAGKVPYDLGNFNLWCRTIACMVAVYGNVWIIRLYLQSTRRLSRRIAKLDELLKEYPQLKAPIIEILKEE